MSDEPASLELLRGSGEYSELTMAVIPISPPRVVSRQQAPGVTAADLPALEARVNANDRAGLYLEIYRLTGEEYWLLDAQVASYSGVWGGAALASNALIKWHRRAAYRTSVDAFSLAIARNMFRLVSESVRAGGRGYVDVEVLLTQGDGDIWRANGVGDVFPGASLFLDVPKYGWRSLHRAFSLGTLFSSVAMLTTQGNFGKRPSEFVGKPNYFAYPNQRFVTVIDRRTGKVEVIFERVPATPYGVFSQIPDTPLTPEDMLWHERLLRWEFLQANQDTAQGFAPRRRLDSPNIFNDTFFNPWANRWQHRDGGSVAPSLAQHADQHRNLLMAHRVAAGLPAEPQLPGRYISANLFGQG